MQSRKAKCKVANSVLTLTIDNECSEYTLYELFAMNIGTIEKLIVETLIQQIKGEQEEVPDDDLIYQNNVNRMDKFLKAITYINAHNKVLFSDEVLNEEKEECNFYNSVYKRFTGEFGSIKNLPYIQEIFASAVRQMKKKKIKKKEKFWKIWLKKRKEIKKTHVNYDFNTCIDCPKCSDGKIPRLSEYAKFVERKLLRKYPDICSGRRNVVEHKTGFENLKLMCLTPESKESDLTIKSDDGIQIEEVYITTESEIPLPQKSDIVVKRSKSLEKESSVITEQHEISQVESELCHPKVSLRYEDISKISL